jgi:N-acetyl-1-D-myo-inositol-2-amino-2-deoxy-alpha-D-glucopyranoside deacetylase
MMGTPDNDDPRCFWRADVDEAARELAAVIREVRPQVMVTYDDNGFYGHPDHIQAHRVAWRAFRLAGDPCARVPAAGGELVNGNPAGAAPAWRVSKFYATATPRSALAGAIEAMRGGTASGQCPVPAGFKVPACAGDLPFGVPDEQVTTEVDASAFLEAKLAAMRAHATQIAVAGAFFTLSDNVAQRASGVEHYTLLAGPRGPATGPRGREDDLFAGTAPLPPTWHIPDDAAMESAG